MDQIKEALTKALNQIRSWIHMLEESPYYEKLLSKYDAIEPVQRKRLNVLLMVTGAVLGLYVFFYPLIQVVSLKSELSDYRTILYEMENINANYKPAAKKTFTPPPGWQNLPAENAEEFATSVDQYLAQIGVIPELAKIDRQGSDTNIDFKEITLKQAVSLMFQLEGWYPGVRIIKSKVSTHPNSKELLQMQVAFRYSGNGGAGAADSSSFGGGEGFDNPPSVDDSGGDFTPPPPPVAPTTSFGGQDQSFNPGMNGDEFDVPPPPPPPAIEDFGADMPPPMEEDL